LIYNFIFVHDTVRTNCVCYSKYSINGASKFALNFTPQIRSLFVCVIYANVQFIMKT